MNVVRLGSHLEVPSSAVEELAADRPGLYVVWPSQEIVDHIARRVENARKPVVKPVIDITKLPSRHPDTQPSENPPLNPLNTIGWDNVLTYQLGELSEVAWTEMGYPDMETTKFDFLKDAVDINWIQQ